MTADFDISIRIVMRDGQRTSLPGKKGTVVTAANKNVALCNVDGNVYAMDDTCLTKDPRWGWDASTVRDCHLSFARLAL
jgi:hypothetical protein